MEHGIFQQAKGLFDNFSKKKKCISNGNLDLGITLITIAHNKALRKHHTHMLRFDGGGVCSFGKLEDLLEDGQAEDEADQEH